MVTGAVGAVKENIPIALRTNPATGLPIHYYETLTKGPEVARRNLLRATTSAAFDFSVGAATAGASRAVSALARTGPAGAETTTAQAAEGGLNVKGANFAQRTFSSTFSKGGTFAGRPVSDVAGDLSSGALTPKDVPANMIVRDGNTLILNTRSAQALTQAGIPRASWSVINRTGDPFFEELLTGQLTRNSLDSTGIPYVEPSG